MSEWIDEGPSDDDLARFNRQEDGYCPECGAVVYDDAEFCPECGMQIGGRVGNKPPVQKEIQNRLGFLIVILILIGLMSWLIF